MRAIILTTSRTGSTFLVDCLDSHPQIRCYGELLRGITPSARHPELLRQFKTLRKMYHYIVNGAWRPARLMDRYYARDEAPVVAFKAMYEHLVDPRSRHYLCSNTDIRVIHLRRDNLLKQYVSKALMRDRKKLGRQHMHATRPVPIISTCISPTRAIEDMRRVQALFEKYDRLFAEHRKIELVYETMVDGQSLSSAAAVLITDLLELDRSPMRSDFIKVNPDRLELMVDNYDELASALRGTEFERFLDA